MRRWPRTFLRTCAQVAKELAIVLVSVSMRIHAQRVSCGPVRRWRTQLRDLQLSWSQGSLRIYAQVAYTAPLTMMQTLRPRTRRVR